MQNFIKTIINGVQSWTKKEIKKSTADWNQNDENAADYVKDRTHWEEKKRVTLVDNLTFTDYDSGNAPKCNFVPGKKYNVIWNGKLYEGLVCWFDESYNIIASSDNGCPFYIDDDGGNNLYIETNGDNNWVVSIIEDNTVIHKLDSKYLDLPTNLATTDNVQEAVDIANNKMDVNNPVGTGSFSMGRKAGTTVGDNSHAEGYETTASGSSAHAEGYYTTASGNYSHAEGYITTASGSSAHAEGLYTTASGLRSHAEGEYTTALGQASHAEGFYTTAWRTSHAEGTSSNKVPSSIKEYTSNDTIISTWNTTPFTLSKEKGSHAEGKNTLALSENSHSEGLHTIAFGKSQHVQGKYNIEDTSEKYAHIVGNGKDVSGLGTERSNAHTLDWNGVGWFQGGLQVGGNAQDDGAKNVLLEGDAIPVPESATVGQTVKISAVDENGVPTAWEPMDVSYTKSEIDAIMGSYVTDIDALVGGDG